MLRALLADFCAWGRVRTLTTLDARLHHVNLPADQVIKVTASDYPHILADLAATCQAALVVAPESDGTLARLTALVAQAGAELLCSQPSAVSLAADKWKCYHCFKKAGLATPRTWRVKASDALPTASAIGFPLVIKPLDGIGCEAVSLVSDSAGLTAALQSPALHQKHILLQEYILGTHASVSLLTGQEGNIALSLNQQLIHVGTPFTYQGGVIPLQHPLADRAMESACRAVSLVPGLCGYVGVDLVLTETEPYVIEINPRVTTSYVGLRRVLNLNLAQAIWQVCRQSHFPNGLMLAGKILFRKEALHHVSAC